MRHVTDHTHFLLPHWHVEAMLGRTGMSSIIKDRVCSLWRQVTNRTCFRWLSLPYWCVEEMLTDQYNPQLFRDQGHAHYETGDRPHSLLLLHWHVKATLEDWYILNS